MADVENPGPGYVRVRDTSGRRIVSRVRALEQSGTSALALGNFRLFTRGRWNGRGIDNDLQGSDLMQAAQVSTNLIENLTTGVGAPIDVRGISPISLYVRGNGAVSAGAVTLETAHDVAYAGTWAVVGAAQTVPSNGQLLFSTAVALAAIRVRVSTNVVGGTVTVFCVGGVVA
jgi:hypothetical protein